MLSNLSLTLPTLRAAYADGLSVQELIAEVYRRIEAVNDPALFISLRDAEDVQADAKGLPDASARMPLWGVPFVVKDNIDLAGVPTTAACPAFAYLPENDAFVVARLRAAGALVVGKTNLDQFATGLVGVRSPYGIPRNSVDPELVPGGSSSGSAVAVGHGLVSFALGTDTAGSGRVPAALNNIVGLKPSLGALSANGVVPACRTLDTISIFAETVSDAREVFEVAQAYDPSDAYSKRITQVPGLPDQNLRVGVPDPTSRVFFEDDIQAENFTESLQSIEKLGVEIVELDFSALYAVAEMLYNGAWVAERYTVVEDLMATQPHTLHPTTAKIIGAAEELSAADAFRGIYRLKELERAAERVLGRVDLLCVPTIPTFYTLDDLIADPITPNSNLGTYTNFVNLLDLCGVVVPMAHRRDGRPGSITLLGRSGMDLALADFAERLHGDSSSESGLAYSRSRSSDRINLAVCGAHMTGLPLNSELSERGAHFLETTKTAACYRLFALAGGPPARPGLLRSENGEKIDLEIWSIPKSELGGFLEGIPSPLSIGTIELANGGNAHGFLVEASGTLGAEDITRFGGWRSFVGQRETEMEASA